MKVNIAEELSKRCMCPRCEVEREAWQAYVTRQAFVDNIVKRITSHIERKTNG